MWLQNIGIWAGRDLYRAKPVMTRDLGLHGLIRKTGPFSCVFRQAKGTKDFWKFILNRTPRAHSELFHQKDETLVIISKYYGGKSCWKILNPSIEPCHFHCHPHTYKFELCYPGIYTSECIFFVTHLKN